MGAAGARAGAGRRLEGLGAGVVLTDGTRESLAAKGSVAVHIAAIHAGGHDAAVKQHGSGLLVQIGTGPHCSPDAVALIGGRVRACGGDGGSQGVQLLHHVGVAGEAAAGQQNAVVGVVADEVVILGALGDDAGDAAIGVFLQLGQAGLEVDAVAQLSVDVGIPTKLEAIKEDDLDFLAESAHADACAPGNPKYASVEDLKALFRKIM